MPVFGVSQGIKVKICMWRTENACWEEGQVDAEAGGYTLQPQVYRVLCT